VEASQRQEKRKVSGAYLFYKYVNLLPVSTPFGCLCRLALFQLAIEDQVFLLDMIVLPQVVPPKFLTHFFSCLFKSDQSLKLGEVGMWWIHLKVLFTAVIVPHYISITTSLHFYF